VFPELNLKEVRASGLTTASRNPLIDSHTEEPKMLPGVMEHYTLERTRIS